MSITSTVFSIFFPLFPPATTRYCVVVTAAVSDHFVGMGGSAPPTFYFRHLQYQDYVSSTKQFVVRTTPSISTNCCDETTNDCKTASQIWTLKELTQPLCR